MRERRERGRDEIRRQSNTRAMENGVCSYVFESRDSFYGGYTQYDGSIGKTCCIITFGSL